MKKEKGKKMKTDNKIWLRRVIMGGTVFCLFTFLPLHAQKPWAFWYWMYGAVSEAGIHSDLQAMKDVGLGGCYLMPIRGTDERPEYEGQAAQLSPTFWRMADYAFRQADSLGLEMGIHICDGFALAGGPWIRPEESMQKIVFSDTIVAAGQHHLALPTPAHNAGYYEDLGVYAIPLQRHQLSIPNSQFSTSKEVTLNAKGVYYADSACWLQYDFGQPQLVRSVEIEPSGTNIQSQRLLVAASDDGVTFRPVKQLTPPRQGWQNTGFNTTFSLPPTTARYLRFYWNPEGTEPGAEDLDAAKWKAVLRLKGIRCYGYAQIDNWEGKSGAVWRIAPETPETDIAPNEYIDPARIIHTTVGTDGTISLNLGEGHWRILRIGHTSTGHTNATAGGGKGLECDKFSSAAVAKQVENWFGRFIERPHHEVVKYMHVDSWECGSQNWSSCFASEFQRRRGYDLLPLLPVYAGVPLQNGEQVLRDIRLTINELVNEVFFATLKEKARQYGVQLSSESVAPTMVSDGIDHYRYADLPMGEFWLNSPTHDKPNDMLDAISGGHVYGKRIIQAEGFTEVRGIWDETPAMVKPLLDRNFALGMNRLFFHVFTHNPYTDRRPGMTLDGIGLFFQRDQTWFAEASAFVSYITRCQTLLQRGQPVIDLAVYTGDEMPSRALTPDRLVPMLPGLFGPERVASEQRRLANVGQPMEESPVGVRHSAGILDLKDWVNPLNGYQYDSMNRDALFSQPFHYRALVVPTGSRLTAATRSRIDSLRRQGILVIDQPYAPDTLAGISRDICLPPGMAYTHRRDGATDIYFIANQDSTWCLFTASLRGSGRTAYLYDPQTGDTYHAASRTVNGRTEVELNLAPCASVFVILSAEPLPAQSPRYVTALQPIVPARWHIAFRENGLTLDTDTLPDWSQSPHDSIRYFSGHARYRTTFRWKQRPDGRVLMQLPAVSDIAHVWVNGIDCGIAWTAPYEVDITRALRKGRNQLEIEVVNTWHNALRGADGGHAPYGGIWTNARYRSKGDRLLPAGLLAVPSIKVMK